MPQTTYVPGVCNINPAEVKKRRMIGYAGVSMLLLLLTILFLVKAPAVVWALSGAPAFIMATGLLQAKHAFCVGYATAGMRHTEEAAQPVVDTDARDLDIQRAQRLTLQAAGIALTVAIAAVVIGFLVH